MSWGRPGKGGWGASDDEPVSRFSQVIRTVLSVMPGGVIRYGKDGPDDDAHTGFWLGVTPDGVAKFSIGGPAGWLKWDGSRLVIRGDLSTWADPGTGGPVVDFVGQDGRQVGLLSAIDAWGHQIYLATPRQDGDGEPGMITLECDGDLDALVRLVLQTVRGQGNAGAHVAIEIGNGLEVFKVSTAAGNVWVRGTVNCADPTADTHALTRRAGDARYLGKAAGLSGTFQMLPGESLTFTDGQLTGAAGF